MKKTIIFVLSLMMIFALSACGGSDGAADPETEASAAVENEEAGTEAEAGFEEMVLFDNDQCTMVIKDYDPDDVWGPTLKVFVENKTDRTVMFSVEDASVNGFMMDPFWATEVAGGKKENTEISWFEDDLKENGIEKIEEVELQIRVYDSEDWELDPFVEDTFTITIPQ